MCLNSGSPLEGLDFVFLGPWPSKWHPMPRKSFSNAFFSTSLIKAETAGRGAFSVLLYRLMYIFEVRRLEKYLTNKMLFEFHSSNGKLVRTGEEFWFPDDVTIGYIIGIIILEYLCILLGSYTSIIYSYRAFVRPNLDRSSPLSFSSRSFENC